jgi:PAS domain S-box-containing protein
VGQASSGGGWRWPWRRRRADAIDFRAFVETSRDIVVHVDRDRMVRYVSPSIRRLGYEPASLFGDLLETLAHPDDQAFLRDAFAALMAGSPPPAYGPFEYRLRTATGGWVWIEGMPQVLKDADGRPDGLVTQLRDISRRRAAKAALAESEARFRLLADRSTDIILRTDAAGTILYISPACRRLGYEAGEMVGRPAIEFLHPGDIDMAAERSRELLEGPPRSPEDRREYRAMVKGGGHIWFEGASSVNRDGEGAVVDVVSHLRDVTERRAIEAELRRKRAEAEAATQAKSEFLANMSHEIRTPLTGILGFAGLLEDRDDLPEAARSHVARIAVASRTLLTVVNDILDFSKIEAGQVELDPQPFDPARFLAETVELAAAQAAARGLTLETSADASLPAMVRADAARLRQVLLNLVGNAVKFTEAGGVAVSAAWRAEGGGQLLFRVSDTGVGIAAEQQQRLFQRFSQADGSISRQYGGTGLGLAICKSLAELMGGRIGVKSAPGQGSTFWFTVAAPACEAGDNAAAGDAGEDGGEVESRPARILIVDDSPVNRELVGTLLGVFGHQLTEAPGGAEAVAAAAQGAFDLILMDLQMPGMDGLAATRAIRESCVLNRATPIVALSANILPTHLEASRKAGMDDHIGKPIDTRELLTKVAHWTQAADGGRGGGGLGRCFRGLFAPPPSRRACQRADPPPPYSSVRVRSDDPAPAPRSGLGMHTSAPMLPSPLAGEGVSEADG